MELSRQFAIQTKEAIDSQRGGGSKMFAQYLSLSTSHNDFMTERVTSVSKYGIIIKHLFVHRHLRHQPLKKTMTHIFLMLHNKGIPSNKKVYISLSNNTSSLKPAVQNRHAIPTGDKVGYHFPKTQVTSTS